MKAIKTLAAVAAFLVLAGIAAVAGSGKLSKTERITLKITGCEYELSGNSRVKRSQNVSLSVVSDKAGEFHIHGYELKKQLEAGKSVVFNFRPVQSGVFDLEHHGCPEEKHVWLIVLNDDGSEPSVEEHKEEDAAEAPDEEHTEPDGHAD